MTNTFPPARPRPRLWRERQAYDDCEVAPCGERGGLSWVYWRHGLRQGLDRAPDLSDCLVARQRPWMLTIWEPIPTKAPGPHLAQAHCCYINTVIFYHRPYVVRPWKTFYRGRDGRLQQSSSGFFQWDQLETRLTWDERVSFKGDIFEIGGGIVIWANATGEPRRWWMRRGARRIRAEQAA